MAAINDLYLSQTKALNSFKGHPFLPYNEEYIKTQQGLSGYSTWISSVAYNAVEGMICIKNFAQKTVNDAYKALGEPSLPKLIKNVMDLTFPVNVVNGQRRFCLIPKSWEKALGDYVFYPLATMGMTESHETLASNGVPIAEKVDTVFHQLVASNQMLLNPSKDTVTFNYRVKTVSSSQINAFAAPGGGMVVFSQLVKEIDEAIRQKKIKETTIHFADGSTATVDLSDVKTEDVLAALIGHEMTHAASRHSMVALLAKGVRSILMTIGRFALMSLMKSNDETYQRLKDIPDHQRTAEERNALQKKEKTFESMNHVLSWIEDKMSALLNLFHSRKNEYEADITGAFMAEQAGFNPLGALYLQEVLSSENDFIHKHLEFLFTHPYKENRKRALFTAIHTFDPSLTNTHTKKWNLVDMYDVSRLNAALNTARELKG